MIVIDNYDSFVYNIVQYTGEVEPNCKIEVFRNDEITIEEIERENPTHIVISPGPGRPEEAGISTEVVKYFSGKVPILGVCLGHQVIGYAFGGEIVHAKRILHGKTSKIVHNGRDIFYGLKNPIVATRYHSLVVNERSLPECLEITAKSEDGEIMGLRHKEHPTFGVQFHPESILTEEGKKIIKNFLNFEKMVAHSSSAEKIDVVSAVKKLIEYKDLSFEESRLVMEHIMSGDATDAQIAGFLVSLRMKGETGDELGGMASVMQEKAVFVSPPSSQTVDTCGTGGDGFGTFNISTATAFVVAAAGVPVAKHGNRSVSSKVGSADVLEAGGYKLEKSPKEMEKELAELNFSFLFAPLLHPAMKHVMSARRQLKIRTAFNLLGPITNPARVKYQIVGVFDFSFAPKLAQALQKLGTKRSAVVSGGFTDELTTCRENNVLLVTQNEIVPIVIDPQDLGLKKGNPDDLKGPSKPKEAYRLLERVLKGEALRTQIETVALNAGVLFWLIGESDTMRDGVERAIDLILSGSAYKKLKEVMDYQKTLGNS
ncbi:bifunctional anthranilate synthase component II/anthranilate phosphoribosyltransferase [Thermotoga sp. KOL6]|uniref:bifunctional anthranilate synthase component II/anthranilate phosphoribosyltransferase n=1 Tax=Thermotoga sp. KOL6 TaxID=126741 RepID=UPI001E3DC4F8|nr:bifunctional anthranilate synthase component II/anthranilate phosphoribosyltransferase [Thermotoga sp. KOL6]